MGQWCELLVTLKKDPGWIPSTHRVAHKILMTPVPESLVLSSKLCRHQADTWCAHTCEQIVFHTHEIRKYIRKYTSNVRVFTELML